MGLEELSTRHAGGSSRFEKAALIFLGSSLPTSRLPPQGPIHSPSAKLFGDLGRLCNSNIQIQPLGCLQGTDLLCKETSLRVAPADPTADRLCWISLNHRVPATTRSLSAWRFAASHDAGWRRAPGRHAQSPADVHPPLAPLCWWSSEQSPASSSNPKVAKVIIQQGKW